MQRVRTWYASNMIPIGLWNAPGSSPGVPDHHPGFRATLTSKFGQPPLRLRTSAAPTIAHLVCQFIVCFAAIFDLHLNAMVPAPAPGGGERISGSRRGEWANFGWRRQQSAEIGGGARFGMGLKNEQRLLCSQIKSRSP